MKINLRHLPEEGVFLQGELDPLPYELPAEPDQSWAPIRYALRVQLLGEECLVMGEIHACLNSPCGRCLEPLTHAIDIPEFHHSFPAEGLEAIDLTLQIREDIVLGLPLVVRCVLETNGKCPITGKTHAAPADTSPMLRGDIWGALDKLKEK
ncbi:MAG: hypothetical protein SFU85_11370 [Candidatus Methylacidiphilales bacterium]|nr:hypothetical protein [Candidatus Methylacidiphilales bacterium]